MPLRISVIPASTQAGQAVISSLLEDERKPLVRAIYRNPDKALNKFKKHPNFEAIKGDVSKGADFSFATSDAVFYVPPPTFDGTDSAEFAKITAQNVKDGLKRASIKRLVLFSAIGAQYDKGVGILRINHVSDEILRDSAPEVVIARPGYFQESLASALETMQADPPFFYSFTTPIDHKILMVSLQDIGEILSQKLLETGTPLPSKPHVFTLHGPRNYSAEDVQAALEQVTGKKPKIVAIEPDKLSEFFGKEAPEPYSHELAEMARAGMPGGLVATEMEKQHGIVRGKVELVDTLRKITTAAEG